MKYLFNHGHLVVDGHTEYLDAGLLVEDDKILDVYPQASKINVPNDLVEIDLKGSVVMPGFFDSHNHGIEGIDYNTATLEQLNSASKKLAYLGTTSHLLTLYGNIDDIKLQLKNTNNYTSEYSRFMGIHMEGPFLNEKHLGMASKENFIEPNVDLLNELLSLNSNIKQMTIAIELKDADKLAKILKDHNIKVMVGHSDALQKDLTEDIDGITHLYNAMRSMHHRDLSIVNAAFTDKYYVELICDGNHIAKDVLKFTLNNIDKNKVMIISDASTALGLQDGEYEFVGKKCIKDGTTFKTLDGHFAGSVVSINDEIKLLKQLGISYTDLLKYSSLNAYKFYGLDSRFGTLQKGKYADIVIMDDDLNIKNVYLKGKLLYD